MRLFSLLTAAAALFTTQALAWCEDTVTMLVDMNDQFDEQVAVVLDGSSTGDRDGLVLFMDPTTSTWSLAEVHSDRDSLCVIEFGVGITFPDE